MIGIESLEYRDVAKTIDHSLLRLKLDLDTVREGVELALRYDVASATVRPADARPGCGCRGPDVMIDGRRLPAWQPDHPNQGRRDGGIDRRKGR